VKRAFYALLFVLGFAAAGSLSAAVVAETLPSTTTGTTSVATTTAPATTAPTAAVTKRTTTRPAKTVRAPRPPIVLPPRVRIAKVPVGGLRPASAAAAVWKSFARPLIVIVDHRWLRLTPGRLAKPYITGAVARARASPPGTNVRLVVGVRGAEVRAFTAKLAKRFERPAVDARLSFVGGRPYVSEDREGRDLDGARVTRAIVRALAQSTTRRLRFATTAVEPSVTRAGIGPVIVIDRGNKQLSLFESTKLWRTFGVATGQDVYPTPSGTFSIVVKYRDPWWYPPTSSEWARGLKPVPPGPGNPLGTRWMGLSAAGVGIHGTPDAASIGYSASHGCIRMLIPDAEWLFDHVSIGTIVHIV
jgi:lipoprotein-anchoring transpeptidase ErfK/SrfK